MVGADWFKPYDPPAKDGEYLCIDSWGSYRLGGYNPPSDQWYDYEGPFTCQAWCVVPNEPVWVKRHE